MRQVEKLEVSNIEKELAWIKWARLNDVDLVLCDLDGTLCDTYSVFNPKYRKAIQTFAGYYRGSEKKVEQSLVLINGEAYEKMGVWRERWSWMLDRVEEIYGNADVKTREETLDIFESIYKEPLKLIVGAETLLTFLNTVKIEVGVVTHANENWSDDKYWWLGLDRFMPRSSMYVVNERGHKTEDEWLSPVLRLKRQPRNVLMVGDSRRSDLRPAENIGIRQRFLYTGPGSDDWSIQKAELGDDTWTINDLRQLMDLGGELLRQNRIVR